MERSQEKVQPLPPKLHGLDSGSNIHQKVFDKGSIRGSQRNFSPESSTENNNLGRSTNDGFPGRKSEPLVPHMQPQFYHSPAVMGMPYLSMDPRNPSNLFYTYNSPVMGFHGMPGGYGQGPRLPSGEETGRNGRPPFTPQSERPDPPRDRESKEPVRTESVIKIASERPDSRKAEPSDKRYPNASEDHSERYSDKNGDVDRHATTFRGSHDKSELRVASNGDARKGNPRPNESSPADIGVYGSHRMPQNSASYTISATSHVSSAELNYPGQNSTDTRVSSKNTRLASEYARQASDQARLLSEHSRGVSDASRAVSDPSRVVSSSGMFSSMPKLTPIAPRGPFPAEAEYRQSPIPPPWRAPYLTYAGPRPDFPTPSSETSASHRGPMERANEDTSDAHAQRTAYGARAFAKEDAVAARENYERQARAGYYPYNWGDRTGEMHPGYYLAHGYTRVPPAPGKRPEKDEKDSESVRQRSVEESHAATSPERVPNKTGKESSTIQDKKEKDVEKSSTGFKDQDPFNRNQIQFSKNEKPVVPDNVRYKVNDDKKGALKSDKVTVYKQGMAYVVSVRESSQKVSDYFSNGRTMSADVPPRSEVKERGPAANEPPSKKEAAHRMEGSRKPEVTEEKSRRETGSDASYSDYHRRWTEILNSEKSQSDESKKNNDKNNNASHDMYGHPSYHGDRARNNRITLSQDKVFVPPNATLEMFEKREQEMERVRAACSRDAARSTQGDSRGKPDEDKELKPRGQPVEDSKPAAKPAPKPPKPTDMKRSDDHDSSDDELKVIEEKSTSDGTGSQSSTGSSQSGTGNQNRHARAEEKRVASPAYLNCTVSRQQRITSPPSERNSAHNSPYAQYTGSFPARRPDDVPGRDVSSREALERSLHQANSLGYPNAAVYGAGMQYPQFAHFFGAGGMQMDPYSMYRGPHMMDPSAQALAQDPVTGNLMMVPEAYLALLNPMVAAESPYMAEPAMAQRFYGMQQAQMDDPRWQQFYQLMQSQQQKHLHEHAQQQLQEKYKHDMMAAAQQQGAWANSPFHHFYQKQIEAQRKEERERREASEQRPKSREDQQNQREKPDAKVKDETTGLEDRKQTRQQTSEADTKSDQNKPRESAAGSVNTGANKAQEENGQTVGERARDADNDKIKAYQFQQYLLQGGFANTKFPFPMTPTSSSQPLPKSPLEISRDAPRNSREIPRDLARTVENYRANVSPLDVTAAVALAHLDGGGQRSQGATSHSAHGIMEQRVGPQVGAAPVEKSPSEEVKISGPKSWSSERSAFTHRDAPPISIGPDSSLAKTISMGVPPMSHSSAYEGNRIQSRDISGQAVIPVSTISGETQQSSISTIARRATHVEGHTPLLVAEVEKLHQDDELEVVRVGSGEDALHEREPNAEAVHSQRSQEMELLISLSKSHQPLESPSNKSEILWTEDSGAEDDFEIRTINSSFRPLRRDFSADNKENSLKISLKSTKSEEEKKRIRENIDRLRVIAKGRTREERFTVFSRNKELRSPTSIVNNVTTSVNEMLEMNVLEKDIRMRLADLQKKYREKNRELARLHPKAREGHEEGNGKNTPVKRGPGRPRKRKYFGASTRSGKTTPALPSNGPNDVTSKSECSTPISCPQSPGMRSMTSEDNLVTSVELPPKKKRKKKVAKELEKVDKESEPVDKESEGDAALMPSPPFIMSRMEIEEMNKKRGKSKKGFRAEGVKPVKVKAKRTAPTSPVKEKSPVTSNIIQPAVCTSAMARLISAISPAGFDASSIDSESVTSIQALPEQEPKPKKTKRVKKTKKAKLSEENNDENERQGKSPESTKTPRGSPKSAKPKKIKTPKKKKKSSDTTPISKFTFSDLNMKTNSFDENTSANVAKLPVTMGTDDDVFLAYQGGDALDMLADFASSAEKRKRVEISPLSGQEKVKRKVKPKKPFIGSFELDDAPAPKKKKKKKKKPSSTGDENPSKKSSPVPAEPRPIKSEPEAKEIPPELPDTRETEAPTLDANKEIPHEGEREEAFEETEHEGMGQDSLITPEPVKERRRKSRTGSLKDDVSPFSLFGDWQPRRSERIFINSSVPNTSTTESSPLSSPTANAGEFAWPKKTKKTPKVKKSSKSSHSDMEMAEEEGENPSPLKPLFKMKKKSPSKGKKRRSSSLTDPDFVLKTPKRKAAKRERTYEEGEEEYEEDEEGRYEDEVEQDDNEHDNDNTELPPNNDTMDVLDKYNPEGSPEYDNTEVEAPTTPAEVKTVSDEGAKEDEPPKMEEKMEEELNHEQREEKKRRRKIKKEDEQEKEVDKELNHEETFSTEVQDIHSIADKETDKETEFKSEESKGDEVESEAKECDGNRTVGQDQGKSGHAPVAFVEPETEASAFEEESKENVTESEEGTLEDVKDVNEIVEAEPKQSDNDTEEKPCTDENPKQDPEENQDNSPTEDENSDDPPEDTKPLLDPPFTFIKDDLRENTQMLLPVDRVFFRGHILFYQEPDLYGIVLNGERGRRPHLRSTDQLVTQAVKDIEPPSVASLPIGTRVCAHWSPQYRCFYPGNVIEAPPDEKEQSGKVWIEFDDGDSGIFPLNEIRRITTQSDVEVEDVESDVLVPERRARSSSMPSINLPSPSSKRKDDTTAPKPKEDASTKYEDVSESESTDSAPIRRSRGRTKRRRGRLSTRERRLSEAAYSDGARENTESDSEEMISKKDRSQSGKTNNNKDVMCSKKESRVIKRERRGRSRDQTSTSGDKLNDERTEITHCDSTDSLSKLNKLRTTNGNSETLIKQEDEADSEPEAPPVPTRPRGRPSRSNSDLDLRKRSLTLSLNNSSTRSSSAGAESPRPDSPDEDSESCSDTFDESPQAETKLFQPRLGKRRRSELDRLRQDLKSSGQLWQWSGKSTQNKRKGKGRKVFYKSIVRGDETISVGDCAVFTSNPSKSHNLPYVGKIESMREGWNGSMVVRVRWFYHPEETKPGRRPGDVQNSLYRSTHVDENEIQTISHKCDVVSPDEYKCRVQSQDTMATRSSTNERFERLFCCTGSYDPSTQKFET